MIDLHTHMLPDWDDGPKDWKETVQMIRTAEKDGITKICLTPHFYRQTKHGDDSALFEQRIGEFMRWAERFPLEFFRGSEVYIDGRIIGNIKKNNLAVNNSSYIFVEFPAHTVMTRVNELFYRIQLSGYIPIISHPERNTVFSRRPELLFDLISTGALAQVTAKSILGELGHEAKHAAKVFLKHNLVHIIASDAHDSDDWPPMLSKAVKRAKKVVGEEKALAMVNEIPQAILANKAIPDFGDPINPKRKRRWRYHI